MYQYIVIDISFHIIITLLNPILALMKNSEISCIAINTNLVTTQHKQTHINSLGLHRQNILWFKFYHKNAPSILQTLYQFLLKVIYNILLGGVVPSSCTY